MMVTARISMLPYTMLIRTIPGGLSVLPELFVWLGCVVYMGIHAEPSTESTEAKAEGPRHAVGKVMGSTRFSVLNRSNRSNLAFRFDLV
jgi:hypothetical protein